MQLNRERRVVFGEEHDAEHTISVIVRGEITDAMLDSLESFIKRQRQRRQQAQGLPNPEKE